MKKHELKARQTQENEELTVQASQTQQEREFGTVEELLRHDAGQTPVPPSVAQRLEDSLAGCEPARPPKPWWKRILGS
jgi:hypothetical protein